jgi:KDO2-lipid IV(A) lauroyltransferase
MRDFFYWLLYHLFALLLKIVPSFLAIKLAYALAYLAYGVSSKQRQRIHHHLEIAFPNQLTPKAKRTLGIEAFVNLIDTLFGIMRRDGMEKKRVIEPITFEGSEIIEAYQQRGENFILITGHYGNWELLSQAIAIKYNLHLVGVGRAIDSPVMDRILKKNREQFNVEMIYKKGALKEAMRIIKEQKVLGVLTDQAIRSNQSIDVTFFNHPATHTPLASILSRKFALDLIPAYIHTDDYQHYTITIYSPIPTQKSHNQTQDLLHLTQAQASMMERIIRDDPKQWFWMHRRWKGVPTHEA